jgi:UDP-N-acetyl-D-mannosaminuronic acid dehydrogenase
MEAEVRAFEPNRADAVIPGIHTAPDLAQAVAYAELIVLLVPHTPFKALDPNHLAEITPARLLVDCVNSWTDPAWEGAGFQVLHLGNGRSGVRGKDSR